MNTMLWHPLQNPINIDRKHFTPDLVHFTPGKGHFTPNHIHFTPFVFPLTHVPPFNPPYLLLLASLLDNLQSNDLYSLSFP